MAISVADSGSSGEVSGTSITLGLTVSNSDSFLVVFLEEGGNLSDLTWESTSLTPEEGSLVHSDGNPSVYYYILTDPATASPGTLEATYGSSVDDVLMAVVLEGVDLTAPIGTANSGESAGSSHSIDVSSESGELVLDGFFTQFDRPPYSAGGGQTELVNAGNAEGTASGARHWGMSHEDGAATVTMSWSADAFARWVSFGLPIQPATAGGGTTLTASLAESAIARDTLEDTATLTVEVADVASAQSTETETLTMRETVSEIGVAADQFTDAQVMVELLSEAARANDQMVGTLGRVFAAVLAESVSATDTVQNRMTAVETITETVRAADQLGLTATLRETLAESAVAADTITAPVAGVITATLQESVSAGDTLEDTMTMTAQVREAVRALDRLGLTQTLVTQVIEQAAASDQLQSTLPAEALRFIFEAVRGNQNFDAVDGGTFDAQGNNDFDASGAD